MKTLKDIKEILVKIPDSHLELFGFGLGEGAESDISLICYDEDFLEHFNKYPELRKISNWVDNIKRAQRIIDEDISDKSEEIVQSLEEEPITDDFFKEIFNND